MSRLHGYQDLLSERLCNVLFQKDGVFKGGGGGDPGGFGYQREGQQGAHDEGNEGHSRRDVGGEDRGDEGSKTALRCFYSSITCLVIWCVLHAIFDATS